MLPSFGCFESLTKQPDLGRTMSQRRRPVLFWNAPSMHNVTNNTNHDKAMTSSSGAVHGSAQTP